VSAPSESRPTRWPKAVGLFLLTFASVVAFSGAGVVWGGSWSDALAFATAFLAILLAHELGHAFVARAHGFAVSPPYFLPFPSFFGTLGAVIRIERPPPSRTALLEMAVAGPIAGALVAFPLLWISLPWTRGVAVPEPGAAFTVLADPWVFTLASTWRLGAPLDRLAELHPVTLAAWSGCFLTGVNLLPLGQLDGGHVLNALAPRRAAALSWVGIGVLALAGFSWSGWWVWAGLLVITGARTPLEVPEAPPPRPRAWLLAGVAAALFALVFMPRPIVEEAAPALPAVTPAP
jgi:membrane-associated protease RseP (regulator of RpoE activity)